MLKIFIKNSILVTSILLISGCATVFSGTNQTVNVQAIDSENNSVLEKCKCIVIDSNGGQHPLTSNPGIVSVPRGNGGLLVNCKKDGYKQLNMSVGDSFNVLTVVNVLFWPGFIVDAASGSYKKYPSHYLVTMEKIENK